MVKITRKVNVDVELFYNDVIKNNPASVSGFVLFFDKFTSLRI